MKTRIAALLLCLATATALSAAGFEIPFRLEESRSLMLITTRVNGRDALTIVDTGAPASMFSSATAGIDPWELTRSKFNQDSPGFLAVGVRVRVNLSFGGASWNGRVVGAVNMKEIRETYGLPIDGLIGQDVLREFKRVVIDYEKRILIFTRE